MQKITLMFIILTIVTMASCSCNKKAPAIKQNKAAQYPARLAKQDTLAYVYKSEGGEKNNCKNPNGCSYSAATYPVFKNDSLLNDTIKQIVLSNLQSNEIEEPESDSTYEPETPMTYNLNITVTSQTSTLITIDVYQEGSGGVHPNSNLEYINWNTKTHGEINLSDLLKDSDDKLTDIAEKIFRKEENLSKSASLENYFFKDDVFSLNGNFKITPEGLRFFYNNYEIRPYVDGTTTLLIPYSQIKSLLKPNTVLAQYIK